MFIGSNGYCNELTAIKKFDQYKIKSYDLLMKINSNLTSVAIQVERIHAASLLPKSIAIIDENLKI